MNYPIGQFVVCGGTSGLSYFAFWPLETLKNLAQVRCYFFVAVCSYVHENILKCVIIYSYFATPIILYPPLLLKRPAHHRLMLRFLKGSISLML
jgi:hypothetical protein